MEVKQIPDSEISGVYTELTRRIQHIGIALQGRRLKPVQNAVVYELSKSDMPTVGEAVYAFLNWNCAILTAFRGSDTLSKEDNLKRNLARNEELKGKLREQGLLFRAVDGWYKEYGTETYVKELSMFVTNIDADGHRLDEEVFFKKIFRLAEHYEQDCFLYTFSGANRVAFLVATNDNGRCYFRNDISFAGPLFTYIEGLDAWTQCQDGKISFILKGMILEGGTGNKKIKLGEGDMFDVESYSPDGLIVIWDKKQNDEEDHNPQKDACQSYNGDIPLIERYFVKDELTDEDIRNKVWQSLNDISKQKCKHIGFHCSVNYKGSYVAGAEAAYDAVKSWAKRNDKKFEWIVIADIYGDYSKVLNDRI